MPHSLRIAVQGCCHGELNNIYKALAEQDEQANEKTDLLIVGGDFQSVRNMADLCCMAVPPKFRRLGDFHEYYAGTKTAPVLTLFVGGNHEASNYLLELPYGGWVAPNIYYMGHSNVLRFAGLRIGGCSGIYKKFDYVRGYHECIPFDQNSIRSVYHVRQYAVKKLTAYASMINYQDSRIDLFTSHDWPRGIEQHGDTKSLMRRKPFFRDEIMRNELGSPANEELLNTLKPRYWFSAHLHVKFDALVRHAASKGQKDASQKRSRPESTSPPRRDRKVLVDRDQPIGGNANPDEIVLDLDDDDVEEVGEVSQNPDKIEVSVEHGSVVDIQGQTKTTTTGPGPERQVAINPDEIGISLDDNDSQTIEEQVEKKVDKEMTLEEYKLQVLQRNGLQAADTHRKPKKTQIVKENETYFLALDKCLPRRQFLEIMTIDVPKANAQTNSSDTESDLRLRYDRDWLAVTRTFAPYYSTSAYQKRLPDLGSSLKENRNWIEEHVRDTLVPHNFYRTAPVQDHTITERSRPDVHINAQTVAFSALIGIDLPQ